MGLLDRLLGRESFSARWSVSDPAFAAWWFRNDNSVESVTPYTIWGLSAVQRSVQIICTIAGLPLKTYERQGDDRVRMPSDFDDPYPGPDGLTPFAWAETVLIHLLIWRKAFLWKEARGDGTPGFAYRPVHPDTFTVKRDDKGHRVFAYTENGDEKTVGTNQVVFIPGPSLDGLDGHPLLSAARAVFSAAISGDKSAQTTLKRGIRIGGLLTSAEGEPDLDPDEMEAVLERLRASMVGPENAGDIAGINRHLKLTPWDAISNADAQWIETKQAVLGDIERLFGVPPHLLADTEKQTSWGAGIQEQNLSLARFTLRNWSDRIEQVLSRELPEGPARQYCEFDYKGLLQGTPAEEIELLMKQTGDQPILTVDEARKILNLPPFTPAQKAQQALKSLPASPQPVSDQEVAA